jgi:hypothetical protein
LKISCNKLQYAAIEGKPSSATQLQLGARPGGAAHRVRAYFITLYKVFLASGPSAKTDSDQALMVEERLENFR